MLILVEYSQPSISNSHCPCSINNITTIICNGTNKIDVSPSNPGFSLNKKLTKIIFENTGESSLNANSFNFSDKIVRISRKSYSSHKDYMEYQAMQFQTQELKKFIFTHHHSLEQMHFKDVQNFIR